MSARRDCAGTKQGAAGLGLEINVNISARHLQESDFVTLHCNATAENRNMLGRVELGMMKPTAFLINCARGSLVDEDALVEALREGTIAGAGLDVYAVEPPDPTSPLFALDNTLMFFGDGKQARDFTYVADVVAANLLAAEAPVEASGGTFNVAAAGPHGVLELWKTVQAACGGEPVDPEFAPSRTGDVRNSYADITAAREVLGFEPSWGFEDGIAATVEWLRRR